MINYHNLYRTFQSAYPPGQSTQTSPLIVVYVFLSLSNGNLSILALHDFSSAFDTIDYFILVYRLHIDFGFTYSVLQCLSSYLTDLTQYVSLSNHRSAISPVHLRAQFVALCYSSIVLRSCLLLLIHTQSTIIHLLMTHSCRYLLLLTIFSNHCTILSHVYVMSKLGPLRTCLDLVSTRQKSCLSHKQITNHLHNLPTSIIMEMLIFILKQSMKNLRYIFDCRLTMNEHVSTITRKCYFELHHLASIRSLLTYTATFKPISAFVLLRIDNCSSLLFGSFHEVTYHLKRIQNYAARVTLRIPMFASITTHLESLHWLPAIVRSTCKIDCLCYHCHSSTAPSYVADMQHKIPMISCVPHHCHHLRLV